MKLDRFFIFIILCCAGFILFQKVSVNAQTDSFPVDSPLPTPTLTPIPISPDASVALLFVADHEGIAPNELEVAGEEMYAFPLLGRTYTYVTILHNRPKAFRLFSLLVDPATKVVEPDFNAVRDAERTAHRAQYGKLEPALYERLQKIGDDEFLSVANLASAY